MVSSSFPENLKIYGITTGLHPPWNWGEAVVTRNIFLTIKERLSVAKLKVYSSLDKDRDLGERLSFVEYLRTSDITAFTLHASVSVMKDLLSEIERETQIIIHTIGVHEVIVQALLLTFKKLSLPHNNVRMIVHNYGPIPSKVGLLPYEKHILLKAKIFNILTTSFLTYKMLSCSDNGKVKIFYTPAPYVPASLIERSTICAQYKGCKSLDVFLRDFKDNVVLSYIGPLKKERFPYQLVLSALRKLILMGHKEVVLLIISKSDHRSIKEASAVMNFAKSLRISNHVNILLGDICEYCKEKFFKLSKIFIFLPTCESQSMDPPMSVIEAMANGSVVVATKYLSLPYIIKSDYNGMLLRNLNVETLTYALLRLLVDHNYHQQLSENSVNYIRLHHHFANVATHLDNLYKKLIHDVL